MARQQRLQLLQRLAGHQETEAARRLAERLRQLDAEERRLQQIRGYLADYTSTTASRQGSVTIGSLKSSRGFLTRLRDAVDEQRGTVETQRKQVEQHTVQWRNARSRTRSLDKLQDRQATADAERDDRREQTRLDGIATGGARARP